MVLLPGGNGLAAHRPPQSTTAPAPSAAAAAHAATADLAIIDEVPPYLWRGAQAFQAWSADLDSDSKKRGVAMREAAQMTVSLKKGAGGWLIHGWAWTGPKPQPVAPAKP